jgi:glucan endo-1,6-beta-glucosidase
MKRILSLTAGLLALGRVVSAGIPDKIYGVNLGSWLLSEPWMFPIGGQ